MQSSSLAREVFSMFLLLTVLAILPVLIFVGIFPDSLQHFPKTAGIHTLVASMEQLNIRGNRHTWIFIAQLISSAFLIGFVLYWMKDLIHKWKMKSKVKK